MVDMAFLFCNGPFLVTIVSRQLAELEELRAKAAELEKLKARPQPSD